MNVPADTPGKKMVVRFFDMVMQQNLPAMFEMVDEDCIIWNPNATYNKAEFRATASQMVDLMAEPLRLEIVGMIAEKDKVAAEVWGSVRLSNGNLYENRYHWLFEIRDEKFIAMREYTDSAVATRAFQRA